MRCLSYCFSEKLDLVQVEAALRVIPGYKMTRHRRVLEVSDQHAGAHCYIFSNGTLVGWDYRKDELLATMILIQSAASGLLTRSEFLSDQFSYQVTGRTSIVPHNFFSIDCLTLEENDPEMKLALSYGFSQSVKLAFYEQKVEKLIGQYIPLTKDLSRKGRVQLSAKELQSIITHVMAVKSEINLMSDFLYLPKFFWQRPNLEEYFVMLQKYLDMSERVEKLNQQLNTLNELFVMYSSYLESKHGYIIEITIVVLIAIELVFSLLDYLRHAG